MKESISYSFLLNIVILFIFVCVAIVAGILSYYRAFRANTIIVNEIEKFEGYNCESISSITQKLKTISYDLPFKATCKTSYGKPCRASEDGNYVIVAYNLDINEKVSYAANDVEQRTRGYYLDDDMNSYVYAKVNGGIVNSGTKQYQFGVYTYMYVDLPVISGILRIPFFSKTKVLYDFRDLQFSYEGKNDLVSIVNIDIIPNDVIDSIDSEHVDDERIQNISVEDIPGITAEQLEEIQNSYRLVDMLQKNRDYLDQFSVNAQLNIAARGKYKYDPEKWGMGKTYVDDFNLRDAYRYYAIKNVQDLLNVVRSSTHKCGWVRDWSIY